MTINKTQDGDGRVFYAFGCTFWTEDWRRMAYNGIPCCPSCGSVGFETSFTQFIDQAKTYEINNPGFGYLNFIIWLKNRCYKNISIAKEVYLEFLRLEM